MFIEELVLLSGGAHGGMDYLVGADVRIFVLSPGPRLQARPRRAHPCPRLVRVLWRAWQDGTAYDPDKHKGATRIA